MSLPKVTKPIAFASLAALFAFGLAARGEKAATDSVPNVIGEWTGTWGLFDPETGTKAGKATERALDCTVVRGEDGGWRATFQGDCGRPYKYTIEMEGRQGGEVVLFKGSTDLGEEDGGVYDWIGRAGDEEFVGFYTSAKYVGVFNLARKK